MLSPQLYTRVYLKLWSHAAYVCKWADDAHTHVQKYVHINTVPVSSVCEGEQAEEELRGRDAAVKQQGL